MRHDFLDRYSRLQSPVHRLPAWVKLFATISLVVCVVIAPIGWILFYLGVLIALLACGVVSTVPIGFILKRLMLLEPFVLGVAVLAFLQPNGGDIVLRIVTKSTLCLLAVILLSNTTPFAEILEVLRRVYVPSLLVTVLALMYRYLFVLIDEAERMQRARRSRTFSTKRTQVWKTYAAMMGQMFVRSFERAERIYDAMSARGWK